jgi:Tol biopolymer transport system component
MAIPTQRTASIWACATLIWLAADRNAVVTVPQADALRSARAARTADVSADGRFVAFESWAALVPADTDRQPDVYVLDRASGRITLESVDPGDGQAAYPRLSGDGRLLVFEARSGAALPRVDIIVRDRLTLLSRSLTETVASEGMLAWSRHPAISGRGQVAAFSSAATTLVPGTDANGRREDIYLVDLASGGIRRVSVTSANEQPSTGDSISPSLSPDGRWLAFASTAPLDPAADAGAARVRNIFLRDLVGGTTRLVSRPRRDARANGDSSHPSVSDDARFVTFASDASNLVAEADRNRGTDVFVFDREKEEVTRVSRGVAGVSPNGASTHPVISADGRFVVFQSEASNLVCGDACPARDQDINLLWDVFLFDRAAGTTRRLSEDELGGWMEWSGGPALDASGQVVAFSSRHATGADDGRSDLDLFIQRLPPATGPRPPQ